MNKAESKYFHTAARMDEALIALLEKKDLEFITVKEICEKAGVNRSTFYLHYETIADLVNETAERINERFLSYFSQNEKGSDLFQEIRGQTPKDLVLITKEYLLPYLQFIKDNKRIYRAAFRNPGAMLADARYRDLQKYILLPILEKFGVPARHQPYYVAYYIEGVIAIVKTWLKQDCADEVDRIAEIIEACVRPESGKQEKPAQP